MDQEFTEHHARMLALNTLVYEPLRDVIAVGLPDVSAKRFQRFRDAVDNETLGSQARNTWETIDDLREGLTAAIYHQRNVLRLEQEIVEVCRTAYANASFSLAENPVTMAVGAQRLTYEYHAFLFAIRRTLEYLARGLAAYFGRSSKSFRRIPKTLEGALPKGPATAIASKSTAAISNLEDILGRGDARAARDRIAHTRPEEPGVLNIIFSPGGEVGVHLVAGAEGFELSLPIDQAEPQLGPVLIERCGRVERLAFELLLELPEFHIAATAALNES